MVQSFLYTLPESAKTCVLRHLSDEPGALDWKVYVNPSDALSCLHASHPLHEAARETFTKVIFRDKDDYPDSAPDNDANLQWMEIAGQSLEVLAIDRFAPPTDESFFDDMMLRLEHDCVSICSLHLTKVKDVFLSRRILRATRGRLRSLVTLGSDARSIEEYCAGLEELEMLSSPNSCRFLKVVGPTLTKLCMTGDGGPLSHSASKEVVSLMKAFCPHISDVEVDVHREEMKTLVEVLCSLGRDLLFLNATHFSLESCARLVSACPKMKSKAMVESFSLIPVLGASVSGFYVRVDEEEVEIDTLAAHISPCTEVESIEVAGPGALVQDAVRELLRDEKPLLICFSVRISADGTGDGTVREIARRSDFLRGFSFSGCISDLGVFENLANKAPLLEEVYVEGTNSGSYNWFEQEPQRCKVTEIVSSFAKCSSLRDLEVSLDGQRGTVVPL